MNLFRSKEHVTKWSQYKPGTEAGILTLADAMRVMSTPRHRERMRPDYVSRLPETVPAFVQRLLEVSHSSPHWDLRPD
jgi:phage baseplate assembly protein W